MTQIKARFGLAAIVGMILSVSTVNAQDPQPEKAPPSPAAQGQAQPVPANSGQAVSQMPLASNLFYNYYTNPGGTVTAGMYPSPRPIPGHVGMAYYTYQPLMPHEHLYQHNRTYYNWYGAQGGFYSDPCANGACGGCGTCGPQALNKTTITWQAGCNYVGPLPGNLYFINNMQYRMEQRKFRCKGGCR